MVVKFKEKIKIIFHGPYDVSTLEGRNKERIRKITLSALTAILTRGITMLTPIITVRITLSYLGDEIYGLWSTVLAFFSLMAYADLGLGSGLQTELSRASALSNKTEGKKLISTAYFILTIVSCIFLGIIFFSFDKINWAKIINAQTTEAIKMSDIVVFVILIPRIIGIPLAIIERTQYAMQEAYRASLWQMCGNILSLLLIVAVYFFNGGRLLMIGISASVPVIIALLNMIVYFGKEHPELSPSFKLFDINIGKRLLKTGMDFFVLSIFTSLSLSIDSWIVAQLSDLSEVTSYSIFLRISNIVNIISLMLSSPLWAANGEALERGEINWVRNNTKKIANISLALSICFSVIIIVVAKPVLWILTDNSVKVSYFIILGMCLLNIAISYTNPFYMILNSDRIIKFQIVNYIIFSLISLTLKFLLGSSFGIEIIPWIGSICYIIILTIPTILRAKKALKDKEKLYENNS